MYAKMKKKIQISKTSLVKMAIQLMRVLMEIKVMQVMAKVVKEILVIRVVIAFKMAVVVIMIQAAIMDHRMKKEKGETN